MSMCLGWLAIGIVRMVVFHSAQDFRLYVDVMTDPKHVVVSAHQGVTR